MITPMMIRCPDKPHWINHLTLIDYETNEYIATAKYDGYRCIIDWDGTKLEFYSRKGTGEGGPNKHPVQNDLIATTIKWLKLNNIPPNTRLDGEWVNFRTSCEPFLVIFGIQYWNKQWIGNKSEKERFEQIKQLEYPFKQLILAKYSESNYLEFYNSIKNEDLSKSEKNWIYEGVVLKHTNSKLIGNSKSSSKNPLWVKAKWREGCSGRELMK